MMKSSIHKFLITSYTRFEMQMLNMWSVCLPCVLTKVNSSNYLFIYFAMCCKPNYF